MEKIRISCKKYIVDILMKDAEDFLIKKKNGEINRNEFINRLIVNYYDEYTLTNKYQIDAITKSISKYVDVDDIDKINIANEILKKTKDVLSVVSKDDDTVIISLKPTKESEPVITYIIDKLIANQSISSFFSMMLEDYVNKVQSQRERIIFEDSYRTLVKSIERNRKVYITTKIDKVKPFTASLYAIESSKEEMYNYCLFQVDDSIETIRLANIASAKLLTEPNSFNDELMELMDYQLEYGIQYKIKKEDLEEVVIELSEKGELLYDKLYVYRPKYIKREGNRYYFRGSHFAILQYFKRFGKEATIISPDDLKEKMLHFHRSAFFKYLKLVKPTD